MSWQSERDQLQQRIETALRANPAAVAVWLAGSQGRGTADQWSDIDLGIVLTDDAMPDLLANPLAFVEAITPTIMHIEAPQNAPAGGTHLLTMTASDFGPHQVDWYWIPESTAVRPRDTRVIFERRSIPLLPELAPLTPGAQKNAVTANLRDALQMANMVGKHLRRNDTLTALRMLDHLARCTALAAWYGQHTTPPTFDQLKRMHLHGVPPTSAATLLALANSHLPSLADSIAQQAPELTDMLAQARSWLSESLESAPVDTPPES